MKIKENKGGTFMNYQRDMKNEDGTEETIVITSMDNRILNLNQTYKLAN